MDTPNNYARCRSPCAAQPDRVAPEWKRPKFTENTIARKKLSNKKSSNNKHETTTTEQAHLDVKNCPIVPMYRAEIAVERVVTIGTQKMQEEVVEQVEEEAPVATAAAMVEPRPQINSSRGLNLSRGPQHNYFALGIVFFLVCKALHIADAGGCEK